MDFSLVLFLLVCASGGIWALDRLLWAERREAARVAHATGAAEPAAVKSAREPVVVEYARAFFPVILIVFLLRSFLVEPFRIPSGSMLPSLHIGDFILVNKFAYGIRLPIVNFKMIETGRPRRGDVAVFRFPRDPATNYIKRVVGVPGDVVVYKEKKLFINGELMEQSAGVRYDNRHATEYGGAMMRYTEDLAGTRHAILVTDKPEPQGMEFVVPPGHYFVMGDNRDQSNDSRFWGFVPDHNLVGKAFLIWFSWDMVQDYDWIWQRIVWHRIGMRIQ